MPAESAKINYPIIVVELIDVMQYVKKIAYNG